jgi:colicin import membrane protein
MMFRLPLVLAITAAAGIASADPVRDGIQAQRARADALLLTRERECAARFVVAGCVDAARAEHRDTLAQLRQRILGIDDAQRRASAAARTNAIAEKEAAQAARPAEAKPTAKVRTDREARPVAGARTPLDIAKPLSRSTTTRSSLEQRHREQFEARQQQARSHRDEVEKRNAARQARGKAVAPLPLPGASSP